MKTYDSEEHKSWNWLKQQKYIPSSDSAVNGSILGWIFKERVPVKSIKHDPATYPNKLKIGEVLYMLDEFYPFGWHPIRIDSRFRLLDGQHRLKFAQLCGLEFVDIFIDPNTSDV